MVVVKLQNNLIDELREMRGCMEKRSFIIMVLFFIGNGCATLHDAPSPRIPQKAQVLKNKRVAVLLTDGFEQVEMTEPKNALEEVGAEVVLVSPKIDTVQGYEHDEKADTFAVDLPLAHAQAEDFDALLLPGGVKNPDQLRLSPQAITFIKQFAAAHKPIAAICHGPWPLIDAGLVKGKRITSWPSLKNDLKNAGAKWVDQEVVVDTNLVTSRKPEDIPAFNIKMIELFSKKKR